MDEPENQTIELARQQMAKVRARARPWRAIFALALAVVAAAVSAYTRHVADDPAGERSRQMLGALGGGGNLAVAYATAAAFLAFAAYATAGLANKARQVLQSSVGTSHAAVIRFAVLITGGLLTIVFTMELFAIPITQLVVGGALTGVLVGIAAQQSLANVFAGIVLLLARPFRVGEDIGIRSGALSGLIEGTVAEVNITYVRLDTPKGPVHVPNSQVLAAAVGPAGAVPSPLAPPSPQAGTPGPQEALAASAPLAAPALLEAQAARDHQQAGSDQNPGQQNSAGQQRNGRPDGGSTHQVTSGGHQAAADSH